MTESHHSQAIQFKNVPINTYSLAALELLRPEQQLAHLVHLTDIEVITPSNNHHIIDIAVLELFSKAFANKKMHITISAVPPLQFVGRIQANVSSVYLQNDHETSTPQDANWIAFCTQLAQSLASR